MKDHANTKYTKATPENAVYIQGSHLTNNRTFDLQTQRASKRLAIALQSRTQTKSLVDYTQSNNSRHGYAPAEEENEEANDDAKYQIEYTETLFHNHNPSRVRDYTGAIVIGNVVQQLDT